MLPSYHGNASPPPRAPGQRPGPAAGARALGARRRLPAGRADVTRAGRFWSNLRFHGARTRNRRLSQALGGAPGHGAVPAHVARRDGRARLGQLRRHHHQRRCVRRSPELRHGDHRPGAGSTGLSRRHHRAAGLAQCRRLRCPRASEPVLRHHRRQHGLDGQSLHLRAARAQRRCLHPRGRRRQPPRPLGHRVRATGTRGVPRRADRHRRHRGIAAAHCALRLLVGEGAPLGAVGRQG